MRKLRLREVLMHCSLLAMGCESDEEIEVFVSRGDHAQQIEECLNGDGCSLSWCEGLIPPEDSGDFNDVSACEVIFESPTGVTVAIEYTATVHCGRRPTGFVEPSQRVSDAAAWLARVATLEAASVTSFRRLAAALVRYAAPRALIASARAAIADEVRHARLVGRLARRMGSRVERPRINPVALPTLAEIAHENAVEGQVGETIGALVATCQARAAATPALRAMFASIARDEERHAELAYQLAPWLDRQLAVHERAAVAQARHAAIARATRDVGFDLPDRDRSLLGLPSPRALASAVASLFAALS